MNIRRRSLRVTAFAILISASAGSAVFAQQAETIGPPALRDFELKGERTTPPAQPVPAPTEPARTPTVGAPKAAEGTAPVRSGPTDTSSRRARERQSAPAPAPQPRAPVTTQRAPEPAPQPAPVDQTLPSNVSDRVDGAPAPAAPATVQPQQPATTPATTPSAGWGWLWLAIPVALSLLALLAFARRRRAEAAADEAEIEAPAAGPVPESAPAAPAAQPLAAAPVRPIPAAPRARLEIEFVPERAAATDREATIQFEMVVRNLGDAEARNIRIDSRMFNASGEREIDAFLRGEIHDESGSPHVTIPPGDVLRLSAGLILPKDEVREIELQGRRLFVPVVAINVAYDWADGGTGRTSRSWVVGREAEPTSGKMGGFRLDKGPRIYRSVGQRPTKLAHVA